MNLPKILKSKRGIAIENAIMFMILLFTLCALLTTLTLLGHYQLKLEKNELLRKVEIDQIGEDYIYYLKTGNDSLSKYSGKYYYEITDNRTLTVKNGSENGTVILYVEAEKTTDGDGDAIVSIKQWRYSLNE